MVYSFNVRTLLQMETVPGTSKSKVLTLDIGIQASKNLDQRAYDTAEGMPTKAGTIAITNTLVQGLIANIHQAQAQGHWNDADHIRHIIDQLQKGFVAITEVLPGSFEEIKNDVQQ